MKITRTLSENLSPLFTALCAVMLSESLLLRAAGIFTPIGVAVSSVILLIAVFLVYLNRKHSAAYVCAAAVITIILWALNTAGISVAQYIADTSAHFFSGEELSGGETVLVTSVISLVLSAIILPLSHIRIVRYAIGVLTAGMLVLFGFRGISVDPVEIFSSVGIIISTAAEFSLTHTYKKENRKSVTAVVSFLLPIFLIFSFVTTVIPTSEEPIRWRVVEAIASGIVNFFEGLAADISFALNPASSEFDIGMQGYSDDGGGFASQLNADESCQLLLSCPTWPRAAGYLIGNTSDVYSGSGWSKTDYEPFSDESAASSADYSNYSDYYLDYCETMCAFERAGYTRDILSSFTARTRVDFSYSDINTKTLFYPLKATKIFSAPQHNAAAPSIIFDKRAPEGTKYSVSYMEIDYRSAEFEKAAEVDYDYSSAPAVYENSLDKDIPENIEAALGKRADYIEEKFTALPECVTDRTYELARKITDTYETDYDKLRAIEAYLKGYTYTLSPGAIPSGHDTVDYFLFDSGKGYCTYFASAMAVLARCVDIPTRYVQGFMADYSKDGSFTDFKVLGSNAHAWVEAYIEGVGWIPFEPTAGLSENRYGFRGNNYGNSDFEIPENFYSSRYENVPETEIIPPAETDSKTSAYVFIIAVTAAGIILIVLLYTLFKLNLFIKRYKKSEMTEKFMTCYKMIIFILGKKKTVRRSDETADRFAKRTALSLGENGFEEVTEVFDKIRYGGLNADENDLLKAESYLKGMFAAIAKKRGKAASLMTFVSYCFK